MNARLLQRFATKKPTCCAVCHRMAVWIGYPAVGHPIWLCDDGGCHVAAKDIFNMPKDRLNDYELGAVVEAGKSAGAYLEEIKNTDLATLRPEQWREFLRRIVTGFEEAMRRKILNEEAPF